MTLSINTNIAATRASKYLAANHQNLQKSLDRLSSGKRITNPSDDAGGLAVSMKLEHSINGLKGAATNISNGISLLQVQDGILASAADIVSRMGELKSMYSDVTKNTADKATYDSEFQDLQAQLYQLGQAKFNGTAIFSEEDGRVFDTAADETNADSSLTVYTTQNGSSGSSVVIHKSLLMSAVKFTAANDSTEVSWDDATAGTVALASSAASTTTLADSDYETELFTQALSNIATLRAKNGGQAKRLEYAQADVETQITNLTAANGRIMDVDIATESAALAKHQILVQASASMVAQANSANNVALQLLQ